MRLHSDILDDATKTEQHRRWKGVQENPAAEAFDSELCAQLREMEATPYGTLRARNGRVDYSNVWAEYSGWEGTWWNQTAFYFDRPASELLCIFTRNHLHHWNPDRGTWGLTGLSTNVPVGHVRFAAINKQLMFCDGTAIYQWDPDTDVKTTGTTPTNCRDILAYNGMLLAWGETTGVDASGKELGNDSIYCSDILDPLNFQMPANVIRVGDGSGDPIVAIVPWRRHKLAVLKRNSVWVIDADPAQTPPNWPIYRVPTNIGCVARRAAVQAGNDVIWLGPFGVYSLNRALAVDDDEIAEPISTAIYPWIERINWDTVEAANAIFYNNRVLLAVPVDDSDFPNLTLVYSTKQERWQGLWGERLYQLTGTETGADGVERDTESESTWNPISWCRTYFNDKAELAGIDSNLDADQGFIELFTWSDYQDNDYIDEGDSPAAPYYYYPRLITAPFYGYGVDFPSTGWELEVDFVNTDAEVNISAILDGDVDNPVLLWTGRPSHAVRLPVQLNFRLGGGDRIYRVPEIDLMNLGSWNRLQIQIDKSHPLETSNDDRRIYGNLEVLAVRVKSFLDQV